MKVRFITPAKREYLETIDYYNKEKSGLGYEFAIEVDNTINRILEFPNAWQKVSKRIRKCRLRRFPYGIFYEIKNKDILVIAVMHLHRKPGRWKDRI